MYPAFKTTEQIFYLENHPLDLNGNLISESNTHLDRFIPWQPDPEACYYDAFFRSWKGFNPYIFPPFSLSGRVLAKI